MACRSEARPNCITDSAGMRQWAEERHRLGERIALVPTMGGLHEGHLALVRQARQHADSVVVSIFVNPSQFGAGEDFERYPRNLERDLTALGPLGVHAVFCPGPAGIYGAHFDTWVTPDQMASTLCGRTRHGHFRGVCTVVLLLFRITACQVAIFGDKDFQQVQIIRRMTDDLWLDVDIVTVPTVRDPDGLAMSSRNAYLSADERQRGLSLHTTLEWVAHEAGQGRRDSASLLKEARRRLEGAGVRVEYVEIVCPESLQPEAQATPGTVCAVAGWAGETRLIDNRRI